MKNDCYVFKKFQKKYIFFQKNFFHFFSWRLTNSIREKKNFNFLQFQSEKKFYPFQQEKVGFSKSRTIFQKKRINTFFTTFQKSAQFQKNLLSSNSSTSVKTGLRNSHKKIRFQFLKKQTKKNKQKTTPLSSQTSSFELFHPICQNIQFFGIQKIGNFFPKRKNFQQYWIFPFLGLYIFFQQNSSSFLPEKQKNSQSLFVFKNEKNFENMHDIPGFQKKNKFFQTLPNANPAEMSNSEFSFFEKDFQKVATSFQDSEKQEFEELFTFSKKIFQNSLLLFSFEPMENDIFQRNSWKQKSIFLQNCRLQTTFQDRVKQNIKNFHTKFFYLIVPSGKNFFSDSQKIPYLFNEFQKDKRNLPQKGEFFGKMPSFETEEKFLKNNTSFFSLSKDISTPLFEFSKNCFFLDEYQRSSNVSQNIFFEKNDFLFLNSFFPKREHIFAKNEKIKKHFFDSNSQRNFGFDNEHFFSFFLGNSINFPNSEKTLFFLKNWGKTQKFWDFKKNNSPFKQSDFFVPAKFGKSLQIEKIFFKKVLTKLQKKKGQSLKFQSKKYFSSTNQKNFSNFEKQTFQFFVFNNVQSKYQKSQTFQKNLFFQDFFFSKKLHLSFDFQKNSSFFKEKFQKLSFCLSKNEKNHRPLLLTFPIFQSSFGSKFGYDLFGEKNLQQYISQNQKQNNNEQMNFKNFRISDTVHVFSQNFSTSHPNKQIFFSLSNQFDFLKIQNLDSTKTYFSFSKSNFFEYFSEKLFQNFSKLFVSNFFVFPKFQKLFCYETTIFQKPFVFEKSLMQSKPFFLNEKKDLNFSLFKSSKNCQKQFFSSFSENPRKFEKVFQTFFSPLKRENSTHFLKRNFVFEKQAQFQNEKILFQSFANIVKKSTHPNLFSGIFRQKKQNLNSAKVLSKNFLGKKNSFRQNFKMFQKRSFLSPEFLLKRDGFVFFPGKNQTFLASEKMPKNQTFLRFEKEKVFQKKRRLKKEKLETRRRKKRKRFFPRPTWLRMNLYKKFLKRRHPKEFQNFDFSFFENSQKKPNLLCVFPFSMNGKKDNFEFWLKQQKYQKKLNDLLFKNDLKFFKRDFQKMVNLKKIHENTFFQKNQNKTFSNKTYGKNSQKWGFLLKSDFSTKTSLNNFSNKNSKNFQNNQSIIRENFFCDNEQIPFSKSLENYKISGNVFREFLRLSWKSSWFQANFQFSSQKIQESFQKMQFVEAEKNLLKYKWFIFEKGENFFFFFPPLFEKKILPAQRFQNSFLLEKSVFQKFLWYSNVRNSMNSNDVQKNFVNGEPFVGKMPPWNQNISEYNRILYSRVSDILRNFKLSETTSNEFFFKQFQVPKRKNERIFSGTQNSFFTKSALFFEKFQVPSKPNLPAFSVFSSLFHDSSIKPTGDLPTLRALWAFQKTNIFHFQEIHTFRHVWTFKKRTQSFKALKGLFSKKILNSLRNSNGFETFRYNSKSFSSGSIFEKRLFEQEKRNQLQGAKIENILQEMKYTDQNFPNRSFLFEKNRNSFENWNQFDTQTFKKFQKVEEKVSLFGIQSFQQNSKFSLRYFKFHLANIFGKKNSKDQTSVFLDEKSLFSKEWKKMKNAQNSAKSSLNFWWAQKPQREFDFVGSFFYQPFQEFSFENSNIFSRNEKNLFLNFWQQNQILGFSFLVLGSVCFQFAIFSSFFKIPEIRSVFKFQFLIFSKLCKSFFLIFFSLFNLFKKYTSKSFQILQNSKYSLKEKKFFVPIGKNFFEKNLFFSTQNCGLQLSKTTKNSIEQKTKKFFNTRQLSEKQILFEFFPRFSFFSKKNKKNSLPFFSTASNSKKFSSTVFTRKQNFQHMFFELKDFQNSKCSIFLQTFEPNSQKVQFLKKPDSFVSNFNLLKNEKSVENVSSLEKNISLFTFSVLSVGRHFVFVPYHVVKLSSKLSTKFFEIVENFFFALYKFLEKPAEFMIEFIAFVFLIEWSSDIVSFLPDSIESSFWKSSQKMFRPIQIGTFALSFGIVSPFQKIAVFGPFQIISSLGILTSANFAAFVLQKRFLYFFEHFPSVVFQPDIDILVRQKKGMIFWDIWAEILLKAAEKYNVNIPSFVTLKEEQEIFVEKLVHDSTFFQTFQLEKTNFFFKQQSSSQKSSQMFSNFLQNFVLENSPAKFFDSSFLSRSLSMNSLLSTNFQKKFSQSKLSTLLVENFSQSTQIQQNKNSSDFSPSLFPFFENFFSDTVFLKEIGGTSQGFSNFQIQNRWEANQFSTFQSQESDFFLDIYLPKSLQNVHFLKYYEPAHFPLGSLICQIYSGIFSKQVSKNVLVVGESGAAKTLFLQALAGETEMKIITENSTRYAIVQRGVAVGMKLLRDVFDAIALQTPCFFVMEDLHIIGSKRPFLISENETGKGNLSSFGLEQQEVHETNQMIYQSSRHSISDFRRPYKGDFSMGIPTNFFLQTFSSLFFSSGKKRHQTFFGEIEKNSFFSAFQTHKKFQNEQFSGGNFSSKIQHAVSSPFPIDSLETLLKKTDQNQQEREHSNFSNQKSFVKIQSCLQLSKDQIFAPPATSPFTVFMMKQQQKFRPKKILSEKSWGGLSMDQILSYQKESSSVRSKVSILAEKTLNLSRGKFDMITDFLVLIDSVRSNRGFVVFGTTHKPSLLDPALRRPGRFDETLSLSVHANFLNRFEIFQMNLKNTVSTFDFLDSSLFTENFSEIDLFHIISQTKLSFFHNSKYTIEKRLTNENSETKILKKQRIFSKMSPMNAFLTNLQSSFFEDFYTQKVFSQIQKVKRQKNSFLRNSKLLRYSIIPKGPSHILSLAYSKVGIFFAESNLVQDPTAFVALGLDISKKTFQNASFQQFFGTLFYASKKQQSFQLAIFLSGKISEFLVERNISASKFGHFHSVSKDFCSKDNNIFEKPSDFFSKKFLFEKKSFEIFSNSLTNQKQGEHWILKQNEQKILENQNFSKDTYQKNFFWTTFGNNELWRQATPFLFALVRKRFLFTKNLFISKMLFFENSNQRRLAPSPPGSSILMPAKKYENFKRVERDFFQKARFSIHEKIQMHQKQRFLKQLYNVPNQQYFRSEFRRNSKTLFSTSFQELAYFDSFVQTSSSTFFSQRKYVHTRHRFSHINQWWNGMFPEHTRQSTYLSDVDWRTMFVSNNSSSSSSKETQTFEFVMDFPDCEQYYNPRNRRWFFEVNSTNDSFQNETVLSMFEKDFQYEIFSHFLIEAFYKNFSYFDTQREMLDFSVSNLLQKRTLKEFDFLTIFSRFS